MVGKTYSSNSTVNNGATEVKLKLEPYESIFIVFGESIEKILKTYDCAAYNESIESVIKIDEEWNCEDKCAYDGCKNVVEKILTSKKIFLV